MPHFTCPFNLHRDPKYSGHPIPQETRHFILNVLNGLLNDLRDVKVILAENDTRAMRVDAAAALLTVVDTSLRASDGSVEVKMPKIIANIDTEAQIATIYEWLAGLLAQSQAVFVAPHRTIERFTARLHDAAKSTRKDQSNFLGAAETQKDLVRQEAEKPGPVCRSFLSAAPQSLSDTNEQLSEKRKGELPVHDNEADANNTASTSDQPDSSLAPQGIKGNISRTVPFDEDVNVEESAGPGLRERVAASRQVVQERYPRRSNPFLAREPQSESPAGSEIIDESCFEDLSLGIDGAPLDNAVDDGATDVDEDIWSFAAHIPKKPIEKDNSAEKTAAEHAQVQAEERTKQTVRNLRDAYEQRMARGAKDYWAWIDEPKPNLTCKESNHQDPAIKGLKSARSDSNEPPCKEQPDAAVDPAFRTAGTGIYGNASRAESVQRQVEDMKQRSRQQRKLHAPPTDFPGSSERENELLRQLKEDGLSDNDRSNACVESRGQPANRDEGNVMQRVLPMRHLASESRHHHMSIDEVLASEARLSRAIINRMDEPVSPAPATPRVEHSCTVDGTQGAHMDLRGGEIDPPAGDSPRSPSRRSSVVGVRRCSPWRQAVAEALAEGKGASRRDSWTGEGYRFLP